MDSLELVNWNFREEDILLLLLQTFREEISEQYSDFTSLHYTLRGKCKGTSLHTCRQVKGVDLIVFGKLLPLTRSYQSKRLPPRCSLNLRYLLVHSLRKELRDFYVYYILNIVKSTCLLFN